MASEGGFKIHLVNNHGDVVVDDAIEESRPEVVQLPVDDALLSSVPSSRRSMTGTWRVDISAEGPGASVNPELADAFLAALRETGARVSTVSNSTSSCQYSAEISVNADGVLSAVLRAIAHFQAAANTARLPAVHIVSMCAHDTEATEPFGDRP